MSEPQTAEEAALAFCRARRSTRRLYDELVDAEHDDMGYVTPRTARAAMAFARATEVEALAWRDYIEGDPR